VKLQVEVCLDLDLMSVTFTDIEGIRF